MSAKPWPRWGAASSTGNERTGRIRVGNGQRRTYPPVSWLSHRRISHPFRAHHGPEQTFETITFPDGSDVTLGVNEKEDGSVEPHGDQYLGEFLLQDGLPVWRYVIGETTIEKRVFLLHKQNTVYVMYRLLAGKDKLRLKLQPAVHFRSHNTPIRSKYA